MARPEKRIDSLKVARVIGILGGTDEQLAQALGISRRALAYRKKKDPELFHTLKEAKAEADGRVQKALFQRAVGYDAPDTHFSSFKGKVTATPFTKHYPPDTTACIFWLKNRKPKEWRDRTELVAEQEIAGVPNEVLEEFRKRFLQRMAPHLSERNGNGTFHLANTFTPTIVSSMPTASAKSAASPSHVKLLNKNPVVV